MSKYADMCSEINDTISEIGTYLSVLSNQVKRLWIMRNEEVSDYERQIQEAKNHTATVTWTSADIDSQPDAQLAEHGLVRLPEDADGVRWTGYEKKFDGDLPNTPMCGLLYNPTNHPCNPGNWSLVASADGHTQYAPELCRHVKPAKLEDLYGILKDTPEKLADELDGMAGESKWDCTDSYADKLRSIAVRLRRLGDDEDDE